MTTATYRPSRDETFMAIARVLANRGTCIKMRVGCVLTDTRGRILGTGYNGTAHGLPHCNQPEHVDGARQKPKKPWPTWLVSGPDGLPHACNGGRPFPDGADLCEAVHAETNALLQCHDADLVHTAYCSAPPCYRCTKELLNTGCRVIVASSFHEDPKARALWGKACREWRVHSHEEG